MAIVTKGTLIERDIDILGEMAAQGLARVGISVTTLDAGSVAPDGTARARARAAACAPSSGWPRRACPVRVMVSPVVPGLTDHELEAILKAARDAGRGGGKLDHAAPAARGAALFRDWLAEHYPDRAARVMARVRDGAWRQGL